MIIFKKKVKSSSKCLNQNFLDSYKTKSVTNGYTLDPRGY